MPNVKRPNHCPTNLKMYRLAYRTSSSVLKCVNCGNTITAVSVISGVLISYKLRRPN